MRLPLKAKFSGLVLGLVMVILVSIWTLSVYEQSKMERSIAEQQRSTMRDELTKRATNILAFLSANSEALAIGDYLTVDAFVRDLSTSPDIRFIHIVKDGRLIVPLQDGAPPRYQLPRGVKPAGGAMHFEMVDGAGVDSEPLIIVSGPIVDKTIRRRVAEAYVGISRLPVRDAIESAQARVKESGRIARYEFTFATLLFAILGVVGSVILVAFVLRPINILTRGAKIIGQGNLNHEVVVRTNDEIGDLAHTFNVMTRNLREDQVKLIEKQKLEQEIKIAMQIQQTLLPKSLPNAPGYSFGAVYGGAREGSGDYYDFLDIRSNGRPRIGVVVADVAGKGIPGAFMMAVTRSILRAQAPVSDSPAQVLKLTNGILQPDLKKGMFVSMVYGILDVQSGHMELSSAGHCPSLVYRAGSGSVETVRCKGIALGIGAAQLFERRIESKTVPLAPGDIFFQYTDGIQHAMNIEENRFGMDRLMACLREFNPGDAQSLVARILERINSFTAGFPQFDDITMVAIKRDRA